MEDDKTYEIVFLSYLDENNQKIEGYFKIIHWDASFIKFETRGNLVTIPTSRILKVKQKLKEEGE